MESVEDYEEKVIYVRTKKVGYLIGTSGRTIRGFETNSGAKIDILKPNSQYVEQDLYKRVKFRLKDTHSIKGRNRFLADQLTLSTEGTHYVPFRPCDSPA